MNARPHLRLRPIAKAVATFIAVAAAHNALAGVVISNTVSGETSVPETMGDSYLEGPQAGYVTGFATSSREPFDNANASSWVNGFNAFAVGASGEGMFDAVARLERKYVVTNDVGGAAAGSIGFYIYGGSLTNSVLEDATGNGFAAYELEILINNVLVYESAVSVTSDGVLSTSGTLLNGATQSFNSYFWAPTQLVFDLGVLDPDETVTIDYSLITTAMGTFGPVTTSNGGSCYGYGDGYGYGYGCCDVELESGSECTSEQAGGRASAFIGDPDGIDLMRQPDLTPPQDAVTTVSLRPVTSVPEPGLLALLLGGIGGLALRRRRNG